MTSASAWRTCPACQEEWCATDFGHAAGTGTGLCNACYAERYPKRHTACRRCGVRMTTRGKGAGICQPCRRSTACTDAPSCLGCGAPLTGRTRVGQTCYRCYLRAWRVVRAEKEAA